MGTVLDDIRRSWALPLVGPTAYILTGHLRETGRARHGMCSSWEVEMSLLESHIRRFKREATPYAP